MTANKVYALKADAGKLKVYNHDKGLPITEFQVSEIQALKLANALLGGDEQLEARLAKALKDEAFRLMAKYKAAEARLTGDVEPFADWELELLHDEDSEEYLEFLKLAKELHS